MTAEELARKMHDLANECEVSNSRSPLAPYEDQKDITRERYLFVAARLLEYLDVPAPIVVNGDADGVFA